MKNFFKESCNKTYFIADIAANHDGDLKRAKKLIYLAAKAGANAAKFQNFKAETIVSDKCFKSLKKKLSHQSKWKRSVFEVYQKAELPLSWTKELKKTCKRAKIDFFTASYDLNMLKYLNKYVCAWKVGSGDITWHENIIKMAKFKKPILIATGASNLNEIKLILNKIKKINKKIVLMQCNTNYTADDTNFNYINLNVLKTFKKKFPKINLGLSDHTLGHETVLGAISLGARFIEKHFTDNNKRKGPDHKFSMNPKTWKEMVLSARKLERAMGNGEKKIEENEKNTSIIQRRSILSAKKLNKGKKITKDDLVFLRPCPKNAIEPYKFKKIIGRKATRTIQFHEVINFENTK